MTNSISHYWHAVREPRYSLTFAFPLLLVYEALAFSLSHGQVVEVRNGADVLLKNLFLVLGGRAGLVLFGAVLVGGGIALVWRDVRRSGRTDARLFPGMVAEAVVYALSFGLVAGTLAGLLLPRVTLPGADTGRLVVGSFSALSLPTQLMISLGAGIYEELLFRVILVSGLAWLGAKLFGWTSSVAAAFAVVLGALIFAAFHYIGPYGDRLDLGSFTFRTVAGLLFSGLYLLRGFGITAWTHALYDVFLALAG